MRILFEKLLPNFYGLDFSFRRQEIILVTFNIFVMFAEIDTMDDEDDVLFLCAYQICLAALVLTRRRRNKRLLNRRWWVPPINLELPIYGDYGNLFQSLMHRDDNLFF